MNKQPKTLSEALIYIVELEEQNRELDRKLTEAYQLNARESSMEAEHIKEAIRRNFKYLYEDFKEYQNSECSEDNYESLKAILKKCFRAVDRIGIRFD